MVFCTFCFLYLCTAAISLVNIGCYNHSEEADRSVTYA